MIPTTVSHSIVFIFVSFILSIHLGQSFTPAAATARITNDINPAVFYQSDCAVLEKGDVTVSFQTSLPSVLPRNVPRPSKNIKTIIEDVTSLQELKYFLEEDERPAVIKFYSKWCKKCQKIGLEFDRLAMEMGDRVIDQQLIDGDVRFAQVEFTPESKEFITGDLQIKGVPTLQMYVGTYKLLEGGSSVKNIRRTLNQIEDMDHGDVVQRARDADDGVLTNLIEESLFDSPDFLNEEW